MKLKNKTVLITGATSGLGFSLAKLLVKKGCKVHGIGRSEKKAREAKTKLRSLNFYTYVADVSNSNEVAKVVSEIGQIDILINNAGVWIEGKLQENSIEKISEAIDTNLKGVIYTTKVVLTKMLKKNEGFIINISSTSGLKGRNNQSVYVASKFGVTGFTQSLQQDLGDTNIKVTGFFPGGMNTRLFEKAGTPKDNVDWMDTDKVANTIVFILEQDDTMIIDHVVLNKRLTKTSN